MYYAQAVSVSRCTSPIIEVPLTIFPLPALDMVLETQLEDGSFIEQNGGCSPFEQWVSVSFEISNFVSYQLQWNDDEPLVDIDVFDATMPTRYSHTYTTGGSGHEYGNITMIGVSTINRGNTGDGAFQYCRNQKDATIAILPVPKADFVHNLEEIGSICPHEEVLFNNLSFDGVTNNEHTRYIWDFGDGSTSETDLTNVHIYKLYENWNSAEPLLRTITLTAQNEYTYADNSVIVCSSSVNSAIFVNPQVVAAFSGPTESCSPSTYIERFTDQSIGSVAFYHWDFGDGTTSSDVNPLYQPVNPSTNLPIHRTVTLIVGNSWCTDTYSQPFTLYPQPVASFTIPEDQLAGCQPLMVEFTNTSNNTQSSTSS